MWAPGSGHADPEVPDHVDIAAAREVGTNSLAHTVRLRRPEIFFVVVQRDSNPCLSRDHVFAKSLMQLRINNVPKVRHD